MATAEEMSGKNSSAKEEHDDYSKYWSKLLEDEAVFIVHSSGTTGLPKLIPKSHRELLMGLKTIPADYRTKSFFVGSSFYYIVGIFSILMSFMKNRPTFYINEKLPLTPNGLGKLLAEAKPEVAYFSPFNLNIAASTKEGVEMLKGCLGVNVIGAVCPQQLGDRLVTAGVRLANEYGMTEISWGMTSASRPPGDMDWEYVAPNQFTKPHIEMRPLPEEDGTTWAGGEQLYEFIILPSHPLQDKRWANADDGSYHTGDMFIKHPTVDRWKPVGRKDDVIKIFPDDTMIALNAILYENKIKATNEHIIDEVVLFGEDRRQPGALIFMKSSSRASQDEVLKQVWMTIQKEINGKLKVGLAKHMLKVVQGATVPRTPKGNFIRPEIYLKFEEVIESAYSDATSAIREPMEPIAIVGIGCRFPGAVDTPSKLWDILKQPQNMAKEIPLDRFSLERFYHPDGSHHGTCNVRDTYFLDQDIKCFDSSFFGIAPGGKYSFKL
jgi:acyl-coenzyme A synthetase/AMP-(fatty) acid ligase